MNADQQYADRLLVKDASLLKVVIGTYEERRSCEAGVQGQEGSVIGAVN